MVAVVVDLAGLPDWTVRMATVLLLIGLPIILATAVVQEGIPWLRIVDEVDPNELKGLTPADVHVVPELHPMYGVGLFTWRNAVLGGVMSAALLVTSVAAYLAMWALGIGPVGSLIAQGVFEERDAIILVDFENRTDNATLGTTVTDAFELDLSRSSVITLIDSVLVRDALSKMGRLPETAMTRTVALDLAGREGIKAVVEGDVARRGRGYQVSVGIVLPNGTSVARFQQIASDDEDLIAVVASLSLKIREKFGESLRSIRSERARFEGG
jgi:hypothetical protein